MTTATTLRYEVQVDRHVMVPMRDGTRLAADVYRPRSDLRFPAVVERTPYDREKSATVKLEVPQYLAERGFVFVVQDVRGRFGSEGSWYPFVDDGWGDNRDGYDTVDWVANQSWCNGKVATAGGSYAGQTQLLLAPTRPPSLVCCIVREAASNLAKQWAYRGGAFEWAFNFDWSAQQATFALTRQLELIGQQVPTDPSRFLCKPLGQSPILSKPFGWIHDLLDHPEDGTFWDRFNFEKKYKEIEAPILHVTGWFDIFLDGTIRNFNGLSESAHTPAARTGQKLLVGPWTHGPRLHDPIWARHVGDMDFGEKAVVDFNDLMVRWYGHYLKGEATGVESEPRVRYFLMAANEWRTASTWPPKDVQKLRLFFRKARSGSAHSLNDGGLSFDKPIIREKPDSYVYDPAHPVPTLGGSTLYSTQMKREGDEESPDFSITAGPRDQQPVEPRCLTYTTDPLTQAVDVVGPVSATLFVSSDCADTDFVVKVSDVFPDGRSILVVDGILRARYRRSRSRPRSLRDGKVSQLKINLWHTAWRFAAGHRLRVAVTSSNFPRWDRNFNSGKNPATTAFMKIAHNSVYLGKEHPSHVTLSVLA